MTGGRPKGMEWDEFQIITEKRGADPATVACRHCIRYQKEFAGPPPAEIQGRIDRLRNHLRTCVPYSKRDQSHAPPIDMFVTPRKRTSDSARATPSPAKRQRLQHRTWTKPQVDTLNRVTARMQSSLGLPDTFVSNPEFIEFVVEEYAEEIHLDSIKSLKEHQAWTRGRVNLLSDGWENVSKVHLLGYQLSLHGHVVTLSLDEVGTSHNGVAIAKQLETIIVKAQADGWDIGGVLTDDASQCKRAREILALRWPTIAFVKCFAHDINNLVKAILKTSFKPIATHAARVVRSLVASSAKRLPRAQDEMLRMCGVKLAFYTLCDTRWNSMQACFASLLRVKTALQNFCAKYANDPDFPDLLKVFSDDSFWAQLRDAEHAIRPLAEASYKLQRDSNTLSDVVEMYDKILTGFAENEKYGTELVGCIEKRWLKCEQPLLLTAFFLHPKRAGSHTDFEPSLIATISYFVFYYYRKFVGADPGHVRQEFMHHIGGRLTKTHATDFPDVFEYWKQISDENKGNSKLADLALAVLSIGANTAPCERFFSDLGMIHTPVRNRMSFKKSLAFHRIRQHIFAMRKPAASKPKPLPNRIVDPQDRRTVEDGIQEEQDVGDDPVAVEEMFTFWGGVLDEIFADEEVGEGFNMTQVPAALDPREQIESVNRQLVKLPEDDSEDVEQDRISGLRAWKISLQELFRGRRQNNQQATRP